MSDNKFEFFGPDGPIDPDDFFKGLKAGQERQRKLNVCANKSASDGYSDIAESMHILADEINRSSDLNIGAMLTLSKTFDAVFQAFMKEADAQLLDDDVGRKFLSEVGIVDHVECPGCGNRAPTGGIHLHDLQVMAGFAAMRFYVFSRLRKIDTCLPLIREMLTDGQPEMAMEALREATCSVSGLMSNLGKMGFQILPDHPVAIKAGEGMLNAGKLMGEIVTALKKKEKKTED